jgi:hypothetical protein
MSSTHIPLTQFGNLCFELVGLQRLAWQRRIVDLEKVHEARLLGSFGLGNVLPDVLHVLADGRRQIIDWSGLVIVTNGEQQLGLATTVVAHAR